MSHNIGRKLGYEILGRLIHILSSAVLLVFLARILNPDGYGLLYLAMSVFAVLGLFSNLGLAKSAAKYLSDYQTTEPTKVPTILSIGFWYTLLTATLVTGLTYLLAPYITQFVGEPDLEPFVKAGSLFIFFSTLALYTRYVSQGVNNIKLSSLIHASKGLFNIALIIPLVLLSFGAIGALYGYILAQVFVSLLALVFLYRKYYRPNLKAISTEEKKSLRNQIIRYNFPLAATRGADVVDKHIDTILVGFFLNPAAVGFYVVCKQIIQVLQNPTSALGFSVAPTYNNLVTVGETSRAGGLYQTVLKYTLLLYLPAVAGLVIVAEPLILYIFGSDYLEAVLPLQIFALYLLSKAVTNITSEPIDYLGRAKIRAVAKGVTSVLNVTLNILLIPLYGVVGAVAATVLTHSLYTSVNLYVIYSELPFDTAGMSRNLVQILGMTVILGAFGFVLVEMVTGILSLSLMIFAVVVCWAVISYSTGLVDFRELKELRGNLSN